MTYAIIGGTGFEDPFVDPEVLKCETPFGPVEVLRPKGEDFYFLSRHGRDHSLAPHLINYRANLWALKDLGVKYVYGLCAVGSLDVDLAPGSLGLAGDFIDFTQGRASTYHDGVFKPLAHLEMSRPYSEGLNQAFEEALGQDLPRLVYVCTQGPRFESAAEINFYSLIGGQVVGMTNLPEVTLARELGIHYACILNISNLCTGLVDRVEDVGDFSGANNEKILAAIRGALASLKGRDLDQDQAWV